MYPFGSLPGNLARFCETLRQEHGFDLGPRELHDAMRGLELTNLADERAVRETLRIVLCRSVDQVRLFDQAFREFFFPAQGPLERDEVSAEQGEPEASGRQPTDGFQAKTKALRRPVEFTNVEEADNDSTVRGELSDVGRDDSRPPAGLLRSRYSPIAAEGSPPVLGPADPEWQVAAKVLLARMRFALSRQWRPAPKGPRFDLRHTFRSSLSTGGEPVVPRWRARSKRRPRIVLLIDGSRSMGAAVQPVLQLAIGLSTVSSGIEVFVFSTALERVTREVRRAASGRRVRLSQLHHAWGGGTSIGTCLQTFARRFGARLLSPDTLAIIASDGLDVGAPDTLRSTMGRLQRHSAGIVWLNPLLATAGYEPTALGMRTARPFVSTFGSLATPQDAMRLGRILRVRR